MIRSPVGPPTGSLTGSLTGRLIGALGGREHGAATSTSPSAPISCDLRGSRAVAALVCAGTALRRPAAALCGAVDCLAAPLGRRPLLVVAAVALALPALRAGGASLAPFAIGAFAIAGLALTLGFAAWAAPERDTRLVWRVVLAGAALRLAVGVGVHFAGGFPDEHGIYDPLAADTAACWANGGPSLLPTHPVAAGRAAYFYMLSAAYLVVGPHLVVGRILGALLGLLAAVVGSEIARSIGGRRAALCTLAVLALHPEHALWSTTLSRDTFSTLLLLTALAALAREPGRLLGRNAFRVGIPLLLLTQNSFLVAGLLGATLALVALAEAVSSAAVSVRGVLQPVIGVGAAAAALVFVGSRYGAYFSPQMVSGVRSLAVGNAADFLPGLVLDTGLDVALLLPLGALFVLFAPLPWTAIHATRAGYGLVALGGTLISVLGIVGLARACRSRPARVAPLVLFCLLTITLLALVEGNSGIVVRHRTPLTAVLGIGCGLLLASARLPEPHTA